MNLRKVRPRERSLVITSFVKVSGARTSSGETLSRGLPACTDEVSAAVFRSGMESSIWSRSMAVCLDCGAIIPKERLEAKPYARYCTKCKSKREEMEDSRYHR